jgi:hypothetical protein
VNVRVIDSEEKIHFVPGPPDLAKYGTGGHLFIVGEVSDMDKATWAVAIGLFVMRGGTA